MNRAFLASVALAASLVLSSIPGAPADDVAVDLELVLAVDASGSVDDAEFALQLQGIAAAFADPAVTTAICSGPLGRIAVAMIVWAEAGIPGDETGWTVIETEENARDFAAMVRNWPRRVNGGTGIGAGIVQGIRMFDRNGIAGRRHVVDVSGDGRETPPRDYVVLIDNARGMALSRGVTINGLAIRNEDPDLDAWYLSDVATGPEAFVMAVDGYADFAAAMKRKLVREIDYRPKLGGTRPGKNGQNSASVHVDRVLLTKSCPR